MSTKQPTTQTAEITPAQSAAAFDAGHLASMLNRDSNATSYEAFSRWDDNSPFVTRMNQAQRREMRASFNLGWFHAR